MDVNKPITNPALLNAIKVMKENSSKKWQFVKALYNAKFLIPALVDLDDSVLKEIIRKKTIISLAHISNNEGDKYLMGFTDWIELKKWKNVERQKALILTYKDCREIVLRNLSVYTGCNKSSWR
jgi:hypothetical protein